jgi:hypothetical protein
MLKKQRLAAYRETGSMTLPDERYRAVLAAERFLRDLLDPKKTPRVPAAIRSGARSVLRHYPSTWDMDRASHSSPEVFASPNKLDDLQVFIIDGAVKR